MKNVLVLGAGQSAPYMINYLLKQAEKHDWFVTVCDRDLNLAKERVNGSTHGVAVEFDVNDVKMRHRQIKNADVVVNFLAPAFQYTIALDCLRFNKHVVTASYTDPNVKELHKEALRKGMLILNEMGLDPGIDIMSAMKIIHEIRAEGGYISSFISYGAGLPAPEVQSNPMRYCITWNPRNVVMAGEKGAQYMEDGKVKILQHYESFQRTWQVDVEGIGALEAYPNRDSLAYLDIFGLKKVHTMIRGTLRWPGWSETWQQIIKLGLPNENVSLLNVEDMTYAEFTEMFIPLSDSSTRLESRVARFLGISPTGKIMDNLRWLGLFSDEKIGKNFRNPAELMTYVLKRKMPLPEGARDMVCLVHEIEAVYPEQNNKTEKITSVFADYGEPNGFTAISKTVGLPAAIAAKLILLEDLPITGVEIPTHPVVYKKVLRELEDMGYTFSEKKVTISDGENVMS